MLKDFAPGKIYLASGYTDLRRGIDGLAGIVQEQFQLDAFDDTLFLFCGRRSDRIKGLYWDNNGFPPESDHLLAANDKLAASHPAPLSKRVST